MATYIKNYTHNGSSFSISAGTVCADCGDYIITANRLYSSDLIKTYSIEASNLAVGVNTMAQNMMNEIDMLAGIVQPAIVIPSDSIISTSLIALGFTAS